MEKEKEKEKESMEKESMEESWKINQKEKGKLPKILMAKKPNVFRLEITSAECHHILVTYLHLFPLVEKAVPFARWLRVYNQRMEGMHLTERGIRRMRRLCLSINRENKLSKKMEKGKIEQRTQKQKGVDSKASQLCC
jgi:hypothetical protein